MPLIGIECKQCANKFESIVSSGERSRRELPKCPKCASSNVTEEEVPKKTSFQLKGAGWAKDGYGRRRR